MELKHKLNTSQKKKMYQTHHLDSDSKFFCLQMVNEKFLKLVSNTIILCLLI